MVAAGGAAEGPPRRGDASRRWPSLPPCNAIRRPSLMVSTWVAGSRRATASARSRTASRSRAGQARLPAPAGQTAAPVPPGAVRLRCMPSGRTASARAADSLGSARCSSWSLAAPSSAVPAKAVAAHCSAARGGRLGSDARCRACRGQVLHQLGGLQRRGVHDQRLAGAGHVEHPPLDHCGIPCEAVPGAEGHLPPQRHPEAGARQASAPPAAPSARAASSKRCSASANAWLGLGRVQGSPRTPTSRVSPAKLKAPSKTASATPVSAGRASRGWAAKPLALGPLIS